MAARTITHDGVTLTIAQWAKRTSQPSSVLRYRIDAGWPIEDALFQPPRNSGRPSFAAGRMEQAARIRAVKIRREFSKLVFSVDNALRTFREKMDELLPTEDTRGVVNQPKEIAPDRALPTAQDSV